MVPFFCPLCKQPVPKLLFDKITGIWTAKQEAEKKFKLKLKHLEEQKQRLKEEFLEKEKSLKKSNKVKILKLVSQKTRCLIDNCID